MVRFFGGSWAFVGALAGVICALCFIVAFWNVREHSLAEIWAHSPAFNAFRGTDFLPAPCAGCERREIDFGGCRCQAYLLTGDARATDPVCHLSPHHARVTELAAVQEDRAYAYRRM